jgi:hypothetical protein
MSSPRTSESDDGRGRFLDVLSVKTPIGLRDELRRAAAVEKISVGEFVRRALGEAIGARAVGGTAA